MTLTLNRKLGLLKLSQKTKQLNYCQGALEVIISSIYNLPEAELDEAFEFLITNGSDTFRLYRELMGFCDKALTEPNDFTSFEV